jgi:hypothetical protein
MLLSAHYASWQPFPDRAVDSTEVDFGTEELTGFPTNRGADQRSGINRIVGSRSILNIGFLLATLAASTPQFADSLSKRVFE